MLSIRLVSLALLALLTGAALVPSAHAQYGGNNKKPNPYGSKGGTPLSKGWLDKKNRSGGTADQPDKDKDKPPVSPTFQRAELVLGQRAKGTLPAQGSTGDIEFRAPKGAVVRFSLTFVGKVGTTSVSLLDSKGAPIEDLKPDGRQFALSDYELPKSGGYTVRIRHDGEGKLSFALSSSVKYPEYVTERIELTTKAARALSIPGFDDRSVRAIAIAPTDWPAPINVSVTIADGNGEKIASLDGEALTPEKSIVPHADEILLTNCEDYRFEVWLMSGGDERTVDVKLKLSKPALGTGTVELRDR